MNFPAARRLSAAVLASLLTLGSAGSTFAQSPAAAVPPPPPAAGDDYQPKFIWGLVLNMAFKFVMSAFGEWLTRKLTTDITNPSLMNRIVANSVQAAIVPLTEASPFGAKSAGAPENAVAGEPNKPVTVENGRETFQGVHVAIVAFSRDGAATGIQPVTAGFRSGDRIKLKVLPTFDGIVVIENINPRGERQQIYPPQQTNVVRLTAGQEVFLPLAKDDYFEFGGVTGDEQLVITVRDPRAFGGQESKVEPNRKDDRYGSSFVQETPPGTFPVISQSLKLRHSG